MSIIERFAQGGISLAIVGGVLKVVIDPVKITAAKELAPFGKPQIYSVPVAELEGNVVAESGRLWKKIKGWFARKKK